MARFPLPMSILSLLSMGAIFGFFYAWVCSTMWGLDATDPRTAIAAMQAMNSSVRNTVFFPAFFLTPIILGATAFIAARQNMKKSAVHFGLAAILYIISAFLITATVNVPMNEALAEVAVPTDIGSAHDIWQDYSASWQVWNLIRTIVSGVCLTLTGLGIYFLNSESV